MLHRRLGLLPVLNDCLSTHLDTVFRIDRSLFSDVHAQCSVLAP